MRQAQWEQRGDINQMLGGREVRGDIAEEPRPSLKG